MMKPFQKFGVVMGANFETVAALIAAYYGAQWLNEKYPKSFDWSVVTYVICLLLILRSWYACFRLLVRDAKAPESPTDKGSRP